MNDLVSEIAVASQEQAQGIEQVNTAVAQMDKVTQQNAANAEESASASEELNAQAEQMNGVVNELAALVGGSDNGRFHGGTHKAAATHGSRSIKVGHGAAKKVHTLVGKRTRKTEPERAIPLESDCSQTEEFAEFTS